MVEVFKTNVTDIIDANRIITSLTKICPTYKINFDLEDSEKILRIEGVKIDNEQIINLLDKKGFECKELED